MNNEFSIALFKYKIILNYVKLVMLEEIQNKKYIYKAIFYNIY